MVRFKSTTMITLFLLVGACVSPMVTSQDSVISLRGSGSKAPCLELVMDLVQDRAQASTRLTYRQIDNITSAQNEFMESMVTGSIDFGSGNVPLSSEHYAALKEQGIDVLHFPHVLSPIGLYHNIPGIGKLNLTSCIISKIFRREIKSWRSRDILDQNPLLKGLKAAQISVVGHGPVSAVTRAYAEYLRMSCPEEWPEDLVGEDITWPDGVISCESDVGQCILENENSIGFMETADAPSDITEVPLRNQEGHFRTSIQSEELGGVAAAVSQNFPSNATEDFSTISLIYQSGPDTWPIVVMHYVYFARSMSQLTGTAQGLMLAFLRALYDPSYIRQCQVVLGMSTVPQQVRDLGLDGLELLLRSDSQATIWAFETEAGGLIPGDYVLSERRHSFAMQHHFELRSELDSLKSNTIADLEREIATLKSDNENLKVTVADLQNSLNDLKASPMYSPTVPSQPQTAPDGSNGSTNLRPSRSEALDDDTPIYIRDGLPIYTATQGQQLQAALVLAAMSFTFWAVYFVWKALRFFLKP